MVTVKDYKTRENSEGEQFLVLVLEGGVTPVKSKKTGKMYFTSKTATVGTTFDEETCKSVIGAQFPGQIVKVKTEPYTYVIKETGEEITLEHRWEYHDEVLQEIEEKLIEEETVI